MISPEGLLRGENLIHDILLHFLDASVQPRRVLINLLRNLVHDETDENYMLVAE